MDNSIASRLRRKKRLGDLLLGAGVITQEQLEEALKKQKEAGNGQKLGMTLVDMRYTFIYNNVVENNIYFTEFARSFWLASGSWCVCTYSYTGDYKHSSCNQCIS